MCYGFGVVALTSASGRFRFRVLDILKGRKQPQKTLAPPEKEGWLSNKMRGYRGLSLDEAAEIAEALNYPLSELLSAPDSAIYELSSQEQLLIDAFRRFSDDERKSALSLLTLRQRAEPKKAGRKVAHRSVGPHGGVVAPTRPALSPQVHRAAESAAEDIHSAVTREQTATTRPAESGAPRSHRGAHRPPAKKTS